MSTLHAIGCIVLYHKNDSFELREHRQRCYQRVLTDLETLIRRSESQTRSHKFYLARAVRASERNGTRE